MTETKCFRDAFRDQLHHLSAQPNNIATKPAAGRPQKATDREKRLRKLQQIRDERCSLPVLVRYAHTDLNLSISRPTISRILQHYNMIS